MPACQVPLAILCGLAHIWAVVPAELAMAFAFHRDDASPETALRRIATEELSAALARLQAVPDPDAVHGLRKNLKKTRALLRLYRSGLPQQPAANAALREVAAALSARRDASVRLSTFDSLFPDLPDSLRRLRDRLVAESRAPAQPVPPGLAATLSDLRDRAADWRLQGRPYPVLRDGLARTRRRAQDASKAAQAAPAKAELVHDLRKRVKDLWYHSRLFAPVWPDLFRPLTAEADRLGEALGRHNDLAVLGLHLDGIPVDDLPDAARALIRPRIESARASVLSRSLPASDRLLAGAPEAMADTWVTWLKLWQRSG